VGICFATRLAFEALLLMRICFARVMQNVHRCGARCSLYGVRGALEFALGSVHTRNLGCASVHTRELQSLQILVHRRELWQSWGRASLRDGGDWGAHVKAKLAGSRGDDYGVRPQAFNAKQASSWGDDFGVRPKAVNKNFVD